VSEVAEKDNEMLVDGCFLTWVQVTEHYSRERPYNGKDEKFQIAAGFP
jgi:hypothetical protein